jgi:hypothetical protein
MKLPEQLLQLMLSAGLVFNDGSNTCTLLDCCHACCCCFCCTRVDALTQLLKGGSVLQTPAYGPIRRVTLVIGTVLS